MNYYILALGVAIAILLIIDMRQTLRIPDHPELRETNLYLKYHMDDPSLIRLYFFSWLTLVGSMTGIWAGELIDTVVHAYVYRGIVTLGIVGLVLELRVTWCNYKLGLGF
jgi:hypothetical protein